MRDSQRSAVYRWEARVWSRQQRGNKLTLDECRALIQKAWDTYVGAHVDPPAVTDGRARRSACASRWRIAIPRYFRNGPVVLHEAAHAIMHYWEIRTETEFAGHGPEFVRLMMELWVHFLGADPDHLYEKLPSPRGSRYTPKVAPTYALPWRTARWIELRENGL